MGRNRREVGTVASRPAALPAIESFAPADPSRAAVLSTLQQPSPVRGPRHHATRLGLLRPRVQKGPGPLDIALGEPLGASKAATTSGYVGRLLRSLPIGLREACSGGQGEPIA